MVGTFPPLRTSIDPGPMTEPNLLVICLTAFAAVVVILGLLAGTIHLLGVVFPERGDEETDGALLAAVSATARHAYPGMRITRIEEIR
jgi:hypothetical protein